MCTSTAGMVVGSGLQLMGGITAAKAQRNYHNANADYLNSMGELNTIMTENAVDSVAHNAGMQASEARIKGLSTTKAQKAAMASRGLASNSFTYQNLLDDSITRSEMDALAIQYNADVQMQNLRATNKIQVAQYKGQAAGERAAGKIAYYSGILSAGSQFANNMLSWGQTSMGRSGGRSAAAAPAPVPQYNSTTPMSTYPGWPNRQRGGFSWLR
ncbi:hypothetical protein TAMA11512_21350 [Selenomonas sp. TAMA-11512]|uniref:hypothetical protein n=1 Tax=Selenomonas sp. TAMA-11512 TaxID=3095337 RepID=UPI00308E0A13|nr:hypothetical protein TAMA11512_21350 [Selenomonas sp. TAMA-11512]